MADRTGIEWTDSTFNPWMGCTKISPACDHCYAADSRAVHALSVEWGAGQPRRRTSPANWKLPLRWNRADFRECGDCGWRGEIDTLEDDTCPSCGKHERLDAARRRVFCASLADVFDNEVDITWLADLLDLIRLTPNLDWLILTKRVGNVGRIVDAALAAAATNDPLRAWIVDWWSNRKPPANVWLGATICNQAEADRDIPKLLATTAAVRFLSIEPLLGEINLWPAAFLPCIRAEHMIMDPTTGAYECCRECDHTGVGDEIGIDWVIVGGESGGNARPMHPEWARSLRDQCAAAGAPFLLKQWGEWRPPLDAEEYSTAQGRAQRIPCYIVGTSGTVHCFENEPWTTGGAVMRRVGKKAAGRLLDGVEHNGYPEVPHV